MNLRNVTKDKRQTLARAPSFVLLLLKLAAVLVRAYWYASAEMEETNRWAARANNRFLRVRAIGGFLSGNSDGRTVEGDG